MAVAVRVMVGVGMYTFGAIVSAILDTPPFGVIVSFCEYSGSDVDVLVSVGTSSASLEIIASSGGSTEGSAPLDKSRGPNKLPAFFGGPGAALPSLSD